MTDSRYNYIDPELNREIEAVGPAADSLDLSTVNLINNVKFFLKNEQHNIKIKEPSAAAAEIQMKALAGLFNERREMLEKAKETIDSFLVQIEGVAGKLTKHHAAKAAKIREVTPILEKHKETMDGLMDQLNEAKKEQLEELKKKILKAERLRHFKNLQ